MKNIKGCVVALVLFSVGIVYFSSSSLGVGSIGFTLVAGVVGWMIGSRIGARIGIAGGGSAVGGRYLLGILFAIIFALLVNSGVLTMSWLLKWYSNTNQSVQTHSSTTGTSSLTSKISPLSYTEIEESYETMTRSEWKPYRRTLIGRRVQWAGVIDRKSDANISIYLGQNKLTRRIYLADLPANTVATLKEHQAVEFEGTIYDISQILGLNLYLTDISFIDARDEIDTQPVDTD